jgi:1-acyl-sn-glycerol-3-phosphate acyltransferase
VRADRLEEYVRRHLGILRNADARRLVTFAEAERVAGLLRPHLPDLAEVTSVERLAARGGPVPSPRLTADGPALIQYTSGSTGDPKGVLLSHANVLANIRAIGEAIGVRPDDVGVSWLPLYHDMGLIGSWLASLYFGIPIVILSPLAFLARPSRWLWALGAHRGTMSPAPNFAFDLCVRRIADDEIQGLDLSSWRVAFNGSEAVSPDTLERFARRFAPYGLRAEALCPVYGLAEAAVALTVPPIGRGPRVLAVDRERFERAREARPAAPGAPAPLRHVACGRPIPGHEVRVVDAAGRPAPDRTEGRIEFRGPSVMQGYFRNPEATRAVAREGGWLDSGDLGYWAEGDLVVTGRRKDVIIKAGRNLHPAGVEEVAGEVPGVRKGCVAAFGVPDPALGTERLVVVAETREREAEAREALRRQVGERVTGVLGVPPDRVVLAPPGAVLKTSSGKIRRAATRDAYVAGILERPPRAAAWQWLRLAAAARGEQGRRLAGTLARAVYTAYVWLAAGVTLPVLWLLVALARGPGPADRMTRAWCRLILALAGCRLSASGLEHLAGLGPAVLVANHASYVDAVVLLAWLPAEFRFVAKRELLRWPVVGTVVRRAGHVAVERASRVESVEDAGRVSGLLAAGTSLLIFPEGTFRRPPELLPFRLGAFKAAVEAGRPVVPVAIRGTREVLPADAWLLRPARITLAVGPPIRPAGAGWPEMVRLRDLARAAIGGHLGEA